MASIPEYNPTRLPVAASQSMAKYQPNPDYPTRPSPAASQAAAFRAAVNRQNNMQAAFNQAIDRQSFEGHIAHMVAAPQGTFEGHALNSPLQAPGR